MSLSYVEAFHALQSGEISWSEYLDHVLARLAGKGHEADDIDGMHFKLLDTDPFGYSLYCWSTRESTVKDVGPIKDVFEAYHNKEDVEAKLRDLNEEDSRSVRKALAQLAVQDRRADVLKLCLAQGGFPFEGYFEDEANKVDQAKDPQTFEVIEHSRFRELYPRINGREAHQHEGDDDEEGDYDYDPAEEFDAGGSHPVDW